MYLITRFCRKFSFLRIIKDIMIHLFQSKRPHKWTRKKTTATTTKILHFLKSLIIIRTRYATFSCFEANLRSISPKIISKFSNYSISINHTLTFAFSPQKIHFFGIFGCRGKLTLPVIKPFEAPRRSAKLKI